MNLITKIRRTRWVLTGRWKIKQKINAAAKSGCKIKIILGSGGTNYEGWIATDLPHFDITKENDWKYFFSKHKIDNLLAEHVLEHLTEEEVNIVLSNAYKYLKPGGIFRIAVPDAFHPNPNYIEMTKPPFDGHKSFWNYKTFSSVAVKYKFQINLLEYFDENKKIHRHSFSNNDGYIARSSLNVFLKGYTDDYTSLVIDLIK